MPTMEEPNKNIDMDPNSDVLLLLSSRHGQESVKTSSKSLSLASPVFAAMLCPDSPFLEGSQLKEERETQIKLDDNLDALLTILRAIHFQNKQVPRQMSFESLYDIAVVSDKYNLAESMLAWYEIWAVPLRELACVEGYERWLFVSYVFADANVFERVSRNLILHAKFNLDGDFVVDSGVQFDEGVPDSIIESIKAESHRIINHLASKADSEVGRYCRYSLEGENLCQRPSKRDECDRMSFGALLRGLVVAQLWPCRRVMQGKSVMDLSDSLGSLENFGSEFTYHQTGVYNNQGNHSMCGSKLRLDRVIADLVGPVKGLSLAQFRPETTGAVW